MAVIQTGTSTTGMANVNEDFAMRVYDSNGPNVFYVNSVSGTIAAAVNGDVFAMRLDPSAPNPAHIRLIRGWFRCIAGFTVPNTFRALRLRRFAGTVASGGTAIATAARKNGVGGTASEFDAAGGGDMRIAAATTITSPGTPDTLEAAERINLAKFGLIGDNVNWAWDFGKSPLILAAGQSIAIGTTAAFDAGGTWEFGTHIEWFEGRAQG
jgi:hypothetical protein